MFGHPAGVLLCLAILLNINYIQPRIKSSFTQANVLLEIDIYLNIWHKQIANWPASFCYILGKVFGEKY